MHSEEVVFDDMDPIAILEARAREIESKASEVPGMIDTFIQEASETHQLFREWDFPAMEKVSKEPLDVFVGMVEEPAPDTDTPSAHRPWYLRLLKKAPVSVQVAVNRKEVTRKAAAWEIASVNPSKSSLYVEIYLDVKTGALYYKNLHEALAYELRIEHLSELSYSEMERLLESLRSKVKNALLNIKLKMWEDEQVHKDAVQRQADALDELRVQLGMSIPSQDITVIDDEADEAESVDTTTEIHS